MRNRRRCSIIRIINTTKHKKGNRDRGGASVINFEEEVKKFHPVLGIDTIEEEISAEDMSDLLDLVKRYASQNDTTQIVRQKSDKELES